VSYNTSTDPRSSSTQRRCNTETVIKGRELAKYLFPGDVIIHPKMLWLRALDPEKKDRFVRVPSPAKSA
jgi:hypothetical protein